MKPALILVRVSHIIPYIECFDELSLPTEKLLNELGLTRKHLSEPESLTPEYPLWCLLENAARYANKPDLGFKMAEMKPVDAYGPFVETIISQESLGDALNAFISNLAIQSNCLNYWLAEDDEYLWINRPGLPSFDKGIDIVEQNVVGFLIQLIRFFTSDTWCPTKAHLQATKQPFYSTSSFLQNSTLTFSHEFTAIAIEKSLLQNPPLFDTDKPKQLYKKVPVGFVETLKQLLMQNHFSSPWSAEDIAETLQTSVSTIKRRLADSNTSLRGVIDEVKFEQASKLLLEGKLNNKEIALKLGYSEPNNFIRAFKRWSKLTPNQYRKTIQSSLLKTKY